LPTQHPIYRRAYQYTSLSAVATSPLPDMDVSQLVGEDKPVQTRRAQPSIEGNDHIQQYTHWQNNGSYASELANGYMAESPQRRATGDSLGQSGSPYSPASSSHPPKKVSFELLLPEAPQQRARLPIRVNIYPHDATDSIITTVKNFYGLYDGNGVSFEDKDGFTLIARYENFQDGMVVYVRIQEDVASHSGTPPRTSMSPRRPRLGPPFEMLPPQQSQGQPISRPSSRTAHNRSTSPYNNRGRRSISVTAAPKSRSRPNIKGRTGSAHGSFADYNGDLAQDYSDSDGGNASVTSSRRGKGDVLASAEISVDNIVEGGRRKRARFDSSVSRFYFIFLYDQLLTNYFRSYRSLCHRKFPVPLLSRLFRPSDASSATAMLHPFSTPTNKPSPTPSLSPLLKAMGILTCHIWEWEAHSRLQTRKPTTTIERYVNASRIRLLAMLDLGSFPHLILPLVVSSQTRTSLYSSCASVMHPTSQPMAALLHRQ
jgi:hypothetical protein